MKKKIIIGVILVALIAGVGFWRTSSTKAESQINVQTFTLKKANLLDSALVSGTVISSNAKNVYSTVTNYPVKEVYFKVGDKVKAGDVLVKLDTTSLELDIKQTELNLKNAEASLKAEETTNNYNIQTSTNNLESAKLELKNSQDNYDKVKGLYEEGKSTQDEVTKAESALKKSKLSYDNAEVSFNNTKSKTTTTAKTNIESQKTTLEKQRKTLEDSKIVAPIDGTVTMVNAKVGGAATGLLFVIEDTDNLVISTAIGEYDIHSIKVGQEVNIKADSTGDKELTGTVSKVAPTAKKDANGNTASSTNVQFDTEIVLKDKDPDIKIGMNVRLTIKLNEKKNVYSVPYDAVVLEADGNQWIYVAETAQKGNNSQNDPRKIQVQKGMETDMYVEISSVDLVDGMNVQVNPKDSTKASK